MRTSQALTRIVVLTASNRYWNVTRYYQLAAVADVTLLRLGAPGPQIVQREFHETFREIVIPRSPQHAEIEALTCSAIPFDFANSLIVRLLPSTPEYDAALRSIAARIDICIVADAVFADVACATIEGPLIYDAPCVESSLANINIPGTIVGAVLFDLKAAEKRLCDRATICIARGADDAIDLQRLLATPREPAIVSTGIAHVAERYGTTARRQSAKAAMNLAGRSVGIFESDDSVGSTRAILALSEIAKQRSSIVFFVSGTYQKVSYPPNMRFLDRLSDKDCEAVRRVADFAALPFEAESGPCPQVVDFALAGVPLVVSPVALRNVPVTAERDCLAGTLDEFPALVDRLLADEPAAETRAVSALAALLSGCPPALTALNFRTLLEQFELRVSVAD